jgi:hypothetical protein
MKTFFVLFALTNFVVAWAIETMPTKCLFSHGGQTRSTNCTEMNINAPKKIGGVCIYVGVEGSGVWRQGTWNPKANGKGRFVPSRVCDKGVEYAEIPEQEKVFGPQYIGTNLRSILKSPITSTLSSTDPALATQSPAVCYTAQNTTTFSAAQGLQCQSDMLQNGYCTLKQLNNHAFAERRFSGNWWVMYTDVKSRKFRVCIGGVSLVPTPESNPKYITVADESSMNAEQNIKACSYRNNPLLPALTEKVCNTQSACVQPNKTSCCEFVGTSWVYHVKKDQTKKCDSIVYEFEKP